MNTEPSDHDLLDETVAKAIVADSLADQVRTLLSDGTTHTGMGIAAAIRADRAAVSKALYCLRKRGEITIVGRDSGNSPQ